MSLIRGRYWPAAPVAVVLAFAVGATGGALTDLGPWYVNLQQPPWKPPDWAFGPAWTSIFLLCAAAGAIGWVHGSASQRRTLLVVFAINAVLNLLWSALFFHLHRPDWSLWQVGVLWLSVLSLVIVCGRISRLGGTLLLPYLAWVAYAATINYGVVTLNGPFGA